MVDSEERLWKRHDTLAQASEAIVVRIVATDALLYGVAALSVTAATVFSVLKNDEIATVALIAPLWIALRGVRRAIARSRSRAEVQFLIHGNDAKYELLRAIGLLRKHYTANFAALEAKEADLRNASIMWLVVAVAGLLVPYVLPWLIVAIATIKKAW